MIGFLMFVFFAVFTLQGRDDIVVNYERDRILEKRKQQQEKSFDEA